MPKILDIGRWIALFSKNWVNPFATLVFNFYYLPLRQAIKLPVWFYGRPKLLSMKGRVIIEGPCRCGMVRFNLTLHNPYNSIPFEYINDGGTIILKGTAKISNGSRIMVFGGGTLVLGKEIYFSSVVIACQTRIEFGTNSWLASGSRVYDTDFHFFLDREHKTVARNSKPVIIGNNVSIFTECFISKGITIPDNVIVAARTNLIKMPTDCKPYCLIGGNPVHVLKNNIEKLHLDWRGEKSLADKFIETDQDTICCSL